MQDDLICQYNHLFVFISMIIPMLGIETPRAGQRGKPEVMGRGVRKCWSGGEGRMRRGW